MTCRNYFIELRKKGFGQWFSTYYSALKTHDGRILDVGCGVGQVVNKLAQDGLCATGVDISPIGIRMATKQGVGAFVVASADNLPFRDNSFASVGFRDFLEHTNSPEICLGEMVRVLGHRGKIIASAPNFLRVIGLSREYHWHMLGIKQRTLNFFSLLRRVAMSMITPLNMQFEFMPARLDPDGHGGDVDAVCITNPIDIKFFLKKLGIKIIEESATPTYRQGIIKRLGEAPFIRSMSSSSFLVGIKVFQMNARGKGVIEVPCQIEDKKHS
jgi:SAM-dependent methyltransferase